MPGDGSLGVGNLHALVEAIQGDGAARGTAGPDLAVQERLNGQAQVLDPRVVDDRPV
jgi:hypothetical protein